MGEQETGVKWWVRYLIVPVLGIVIGGGGITAIWIAKKQNPSKESSRRAARERMLSQEKGVKDLPPPPPPAPFIAKPLDMDDREYEAKSAEFYAEQGEEEKRIEGKASIGKIEDEDSLLQSFYATSKWATSPDLGLEVPFGQAVTFHWRLNNDRFHSTVLQSVTLDGDIVSSQMVGQEGWRTITPPSTMDYFIVRRDPEKAGSVKILGSMRITVLR